MTADVHKSPQSVHNVWMIAKHPSFQIVHNAKRVGVTCLTCPTDLIWLSPLCPCHFQVIHLQSQELLQAKIVSVRLVVKAVWAVWARKTRFKQSNYCCGATTFIFDSILVLSQLPVCLFFVVLRGSSGRPAGVSSAAPSNSADPPTEAAATASLRQTPLPWAANLLTPPCCSVLPAYLVQ